MSRLAAWLGSRKASSVWRTVAGVQLACAALDVVVGSYLNAAIITLASVASGYTSRIFRRMERPALPEARTRSKRS